MKKPSGELSGSAAYLRGFAAGEVIVRQGEPGEAFYIVHKGLVELSRFDSQRHRVEAQISKGGFFGELALLTQTDQATTATAIEETAVLVVKRDKMSAMIKSQPEIAVRLLQQLAGRLHGAMDQVDVLIHRQPTVRVAHALLQAARRRGVEAEGGLLLEELDQSALAQQLGLMPSEVSRELDKLVRSGTAQLRGPGLLIPDLSPLEEFVESMEMRFVESS